MSSRPNVHRLRYVHVVCLVTFGIAVSCERHTPPESAGSGPGESSPVQSQARVQVAAPDGMSAGVAQLVREQEAELATRPDDAQAYLRLGMIYDRNSFPEAAAEAYGIAATLQPDDARSRYHLGRMREVLGDVPGAIDALRSCVQRAPDAVMAHARMADLALSLGRLEDAEDGFFAAARADGEHPVGPEGLARVAFARGDAAGAAALLEAYLTRHPNRGYARFLLGTAYRALGRLDEARVQLEASAGSSPAAPDPWLDETAAWLAGYHGVMGRAVELGRAGEAEQIVDSLRALRAELPDDFAALEKLVAAELQLQRADEAQVALNDFLSRWPEHPRARYLMALVLEAQGDLVGGREAAQQSLDAQGDWVPAHELAARLAWRSEDLKAAATSLEAALHHGGPKHDTLLKLARARALLGDPAAARVALRGATEASPQSVEAWVLLCADALKSAAPPPQWVQADVAEARTAWERAHALAPDDPRVKQLGVALQEVPDSDG